MCGNGNRTAFQSFFVCNVRIFSHCIDSRIIMWYDKCEIILILIEKESVS